MNYLALSDDELVQMLADDVPCGDITTDTAGIGVKAGRLVFCARKNLVVCAIEEAARMFELSGVKVEMCVNSGQQVGTNMRLLEARGPVRILHRVWKTAQVLVEWASGVSTASAAIVSAAYPVAVACTRIMCPALRPCR